MIFRVLKRGEKLARALENQPSENSVSDAGMRYDLTVPLARVVAEYRGQLPGFFKRYQIQAVYRADLKQWPENGWSLYGLAITLREQIKMGEARDTEAAFKRAFEEADARLKTSVFR